MKFVIHFFDPLRGVPSPPGKYAPAWETVRSKVYAPSTQTTGYMQTVIYPNIVVTYKNNGFQYGVTGTAMCFWTCFQQNIVYS